MTFSIVPGLQQGFYFGTETFGVPVAARPGHFIHIHFCNALETVNFEDSAPGTCLSIAHELNFAVTW